MVRFRSRVDVFEAINRCEWQKVKDAVVPGKANVRDQQYDATLLHWAVNEGHVPTVEHLLACGADVRLRDGKHSATPLHWAAAKGHAFVVRLLMMQESDVNSRDASSRTPLHWAAGNGQLGVIRELLFWGARVECTDVWRKVPLHWAAFRGHVSSVEELVGKGSPIDQLDADGCLPGTTFHQSVPDNVREAIRAAMKQGPASGDSVVRAATVSSELLLETLHACRSWGELFENRHFDVLSKECQEHRERLRGVIQGLADQGKAESLEPCLKAMDLLNSALRLHEDMRQGNKPIPLKGSGYRSGTNSNGASGGGSNRDSSGSGPPRAGGEHRGSEDLRDFLSTGAGPGGAGGVPHGGAEGLGGAGASSAASLRLYQLGAVREACGGFAADRCIGEGGFGKVYRGSMMGLPVAVKKLDETGLQGREQFFREVEVLSTCRHENIVPLLGVCMEPPCLVYRLMPNNSLRHHLDDAALRQRLGWRLRVRATLHMCRGLDYLHSESPSKPKVIHGDIKPENILLDEYMKARLADFGISRVGETEAGDSRPRPRGGRGAPAADDAALQGTFGYMDPVYQSSGLLDERSDVFSLGVVMLELLTGDPVHSPNKQPPGVVDRVRKALEERTLKSVVDRSAVWNKTAAKAFARLACACCAEKPGARPALGEVADKVTAIQEAGQKSVEGSAVGVSRSVSTPTNASSAQQSQHSNDVLVELFDDAHQNSKCARASMGGAGASSAAAAPPLAPVGTGAGGFESAPAATPSGSELGALQSDSTGRLGRHRTSPGPPPSPPPRPPPPPSYEVAVHNPPAAAPVAAAAAPAIAVAPPPYLEVLDSSGGGDLVPVDTDEARRDFVERQGDVQHGIADGAVEELVDLSDATEIAGAWTSAGATVGGGGGAGNEWWASASGRGPPARSGSSNHDAEVGEGGAAYANSAKDPGGASEYDEARSPTFVDVAGAGRSASVSCTQSTSLAEYGVDIPGVLHAARGGGVLSSNPRLLCVCCTGAATTPEAKIAPGGATTSATPPPVDGGEGVVRQAGHVSVLDLWHPRRTVGYPVAADRAAMSPNQSESVIAVMGGGSLHVFSIPRRCRLQEQAVATDLCMWRWSSPWGLALVTNSAVFYWSISENPATGASPDHTVKRGRRSSGDGGSRESVDETHERDAATRFRRPRQVFPRRRTLAPPETFHRVYDYQASADGLWGMLLCAVVDSDWGGGPGGGLGNGYGSHCSGIEGGGGPVKVDLYSFARAVTFEFEVLGASLMTMPGSSPPLNLLGLVVRGEAGGTELRVLDLDRSLSQADDPEALARLAEEGEGWLIEATHVIADGDLRGSSACRVVNIDGKLGPVASAWAPPAAVACGMGGGQAGQTPGTSPLVSPPVFLRQWTENTNVVFLVGCHGLLLLLDVVTGAELARAQACSPPVVEAEVDPDVGDLVVVSTADGGGVHRLTVHAAALRERVEYDHKDPEMATRVSAPSGYGAVRPSLPPRRQSSRTHS